MAMETDLVRTLKQIISLRDSSRQGHKMGGSAQSLDQSVTLFGKRLSVKSEDHQDDDRTTGLLVSEKRLPTAILHLKEHLKRKAARHVETADALTTLPLLNGIQDKDSEVGFKRQRIGQDQHRFPVSSSKQAPARFQASAGMGELQAGPESEMDSGATSEGPPSNESSSEAAPLTMFYNGQVYVYEEIPADKAQAIMVLAGSSSSSSSRASSDTLPGSGIAPQENRSSPPPKKRAFTLADLPQARKASLQRFLELRKERLVLRDDKMNLKKKSRSGTPPKSPPGMKVFNEEAAQRAGVLVDRQ